MALIELCGRRRQCEALSGWLRPLLIDKVNLAAIVLLMYGRRGSADWGAFLPIKPMDWALLVPAVAE